MTSAKDVDAYIESAPAAAQPMLREIRRIILDSVPSVTEKVSYVMPSYEQRGQRLVHFSAAKAHVGVYGLVHVELTCRRSSPLPGPSEHLTVPARPASAGGGTGRRDPAEGRNALMFVEGLSATGGGPST